MANQKEEKKKIEVINGDGTNLNISPVHEYINTVKPKGKDQSPKNIVIPGEKKNESTEDSKK